MSGKKRSGGADEPSAPFWMLTYGDVMTLLLTFFVLLLSFSSIQESKFKEAMGALQAALGVLESDEGTIDVVVPPDMPSELAELLESEAEVSDVSEIMLDAGLAEDIDVVPTEQGYAIRISSPVLFDPASADLKPAGQTALEKLGKFLKPKASSVRVEGHTDSIPIHTDRFPSNWELSTARALSVLKFLNGAGVNSKRLSAAGYGEFKPLVENDSDEHRQVNRRVEIYVNTVAENDE